MRTESQMLDLILYFARKDDRIRVVVMNGSRANPKIPPDIFQDYDIVYFVKDLVPFVHDLNLIANFGDPIIYQFPDEMGDSQPSHLSSYAYLMQFADSNRIDLTFRLLVDLDQAIQSDSLTKVLLDKDHQVFDLTPSSDKDYLPQRPTKKQFDDCCNEFWWLNPYDAKGYWRRELISPGYYKDCLLKRELLKMLTWYFGVQTYFRIAPGKHGRFFHQAFPSPVWQMVRKCYSEDPTENRWESLYRFGNLFRLVAQEVAGHFGYAYPQKEDDRVSSFIRSVEHLPPDATSFGL